MSPHARAALIAPAVGVLTMVALSACGGSDPAPIEIPEAPAAEASETNPDPEPDPQERDVAAAKAAYEEFVTTLNTVGASGYEDPAPVSALLWGDVDYRTAVLDSLIDYHRRGITQVGEQRIVDLTLAEYLPDPSDTGQRVVLDACVDNSDVDQIDPDGTSILMDDGVDRIPATVTMQHSEEQWTVSNVEWHRGEQC